MPSNDYLRLFDPDPVRAAAKYADLFRRLVKFFEWRQCRSPEDLAQETMSRALAKIPSVTIVALDPAAYFFGFAKNLVREDRKGARRDERRIARLDQDRSPSQEEDGPAWPGEEEHLGAIGVLPDSLADLHRLDDRKTLQLRLQCLPAADRKLIVQYCLRDHRGRGLLAEELGMTRNALSVRAHRIKRRLVEEGGRSGQPMKHNPPPRH